MDAIRKCRQKSLIKPDWLHNVTLILTDVLCSLTNTEIKKKAGYRVSLNFLCGDKTACHD